MNFLRILDFSPVIFYPFAFHSRKLPRVRLGFRFLRHIERNSLLLFLIPADADDIHQEYKILLNELAQYNPELLDKRRILAISKSDMLDEELMFEMSRYLPDVPYIFISSITGLGISSLKDILWRELNSSEITPIIAAREALVHRNLDVRALEFEPEEEFAPDLDDDLEEEEDYEEDF